MRINVITKRNSGKDAGQYSMTFWCEVTLLIDLRPGYEGFTIRQNVGNCLRADGA